MDSEKTMDFKALMAKFQDEELLLKQPRIKPALPEKPKVVPPPQSPTHHLPAGARPSLLTSINQSLERKTAIAPRVVFKDEKKEAKKPLIQTNIKGKEKSDGKLKVSKYKTKGNKAKVDDNSSAQKQKKENGKDTAELVPATPPPKATTKKKGFLGFKRSIKTDSVQAAEDPILDMPSSDVPGLTPLIPVPSGFGDTPPEPEISAPKALMPNIPTIPDYSVTVKPTPPSIVPPSTDFTPSPPCIPDIPAPEVPTPEKETPSEIETPAQSLSRPASQNEITPSPPSTAPTPPPSAVISAPPPVASTPVAEVAARPDIEAIINAAVEKPPPQVTDLPSITSSPKPERPISALSALERAEDMNPGKRTSPADQRIFNALEKARRKTVSPISTSSITPPPEELSPPQSPSHSVPELPPIDYHAGNCRSAKPVNGINHREASPVSGGITDEGSDVVPELLVVPPPPQKPARPLSVNLNEFTTPRPAGDNEVLASADFSETDIPEFDDETSDAHYPELQDSESGNRNYTGPDTVDSQNLSGIYSNGISTPGAELHAGSGLDDEYQDFLLPKSSFPVPDPQESPSVMVPQAGVGNGMYESSENVYEDVTTSVTKKKGKSDGGKKRKGPPKNPYDEAPRQTNEEKSKTGRFGKIDKKAAAEGLDEKELKKKEKQRMEKEKKELKEKQEREKKEQKEREKKENELKKKFKITGQEDAMYQAKVTVTTKGRKNDLPVKSDDIISIIRTTNCPKGKWLARDSSNNYGYVAVDHVELDIKEMLELGKKSVYRKSSNNVMEEEVPRTGSRQSNHYPQSESFTDDSEEWTAEDDENFSPTHEAANPLAPAGHTRTLSMPDMGNKDLAINHQHSHSDMSTDSSHMQARHEALQKLATFFHSPVPVAPASNITELESTPVLVKAEAVHLPEPSETQDMDFDCPDLLILPPPDLYADLNTD